MGALEKITNELWFADLAMSTKSRDKHIANAQKVIEKFYKSIANHRVVVTFTPYSRPNHPTSEMFR